MILNNYIIKQDLLEIEKINKNKNFIFMYIVILVLFFLFAYMSLKEFVFLDLLAGVFCKIGIFIFLLLIVESFTLSVMKYLKKDECIQENFWKVEEHNLSAKTIKNNKFIFIFTGNYRYQVSKKLYEKTNIGTRFFVVLKDKPCGRLIQYKREVLNIYLKEKYTKYDNTTIAKKKESQLKITNKLIKKILYYYNLPDSIEISLLSGVVSFIIGTIFQVLKQQYFTYFSDYISVMLLFILFVLMFLFLLSRNKNTLKYVSLENCVLVEEKNNYSLLGKNNNEYILIKFLPKNQYLDVSDNVNKKREI